MSDRFPSQPDENETIRLPYPVPYYAQVASPELAGPIFSEGLDPVLDPRWAESGAVDPAEYAYWTDRACGVACLKMCVEALGGPVRPLVEWARQGLARGGYRIDQDEQGRALERGWVHRALAEMAAEEALSATALPLALEALPEHLRQGRLVITSVSFEIGTDLPITRQGGHLVVVCGAELCAGSLAALHIHNPSGRTPAMRASARIPAIRFALGYSGRAILIGPRSVRRP